METKIISIFDQQLGKREHFDYAMFFEINAQPYKFTNDPRDFYDCVLLDAQNGDMIRPGIPWIELFITHADETSIKDLDRITRTYPNCKIISNIANFQHSNHVYVDFLFNRTKAYYGQYPFRKNVMKWYWHGQLSFITFPLIDSSSKHNIFVAPNKSHRGTKIFRTQLIQRLQIYRDKGYVSDYDTDSRQGPFLYPHIEFPQTNCINEIESQTRPLSYGYWGYCPPHNAYYQNTFMSIYGETIEHGTVLFYSEKTYDPLIKGHFILPFSVCGYVQNLADQGIVFPDFIDYAYDSIVDDQSRFDAYWREAERLIKLDLTTWRDLYDQNLEILYQNQLWFHKKPYDRVDFLNFLHTEKNDLA